MSLMDYSGPEGDNYHRERHKEIFGNSGLLDAWGRYSMAVYFADVRPGMRVLEIGAGSGINLVHAVNQFDVYAVEPSEFARGHCAQLGIRAFKSIDELPRDVMFDKILIRHVLEHVQEPRTFLVSLMALMAPRGSVTIVVPCGQPLAKINPHDINFHLYCWNRQSLWNLTLDAGLKPTSAFVNWYNGRRLLTPILRIFGERAYVRGLHILGRLRRSSEIVVVASNDAN